MYIRVCIYVCMYVYMYVCMYICVYIRVCMYVCMYVCIYIYIYIYLPNSTQHRNVLYEARGIVRSRSEVLPCSPPIWQRALLPPARTRAVSSWQGEEGEEERERREKGREREERKKPRDRPGPLKNTARIIPSHHRTIKAWSSSSPA